MTPLMQPVVRPTSAQVPPWLWLWMILFLWQVPDRADDFRQIIEDYLAIGGSLAPGTWSTRQVLWFRNIFMITTLVEPLCWLTLLAGIMLTLVPTLRAWMIKRKYKVHAPGSAPRDPVPDIIEFIRQQAPDIAVMVYRPDTSLYAFVYPLGYRQTALAVFGRLIMTWGSNRAAAEGILLHEVAHYRQRDALLLGVGSPFEYVVQKWHVLLLLLTVAPPVAALVGNAIQWRAGGYLPEIYGTAGSALDSSLTLFARGIAASTARLALWTTATFLLPIAAIWCTEFNADRFALAAETRPGTYLSWLRQLRDTPRRRWEPGRSLFGTIKSVSSVVSERISHPPMALRVWFVEHAARWYSLALILLLFPAAYLVRLSLLLGWSIVQRLAGGLSMDDVLDAVPDNIADFAATMALPLLLFSGVIGLWPLAALVWDRFLQKTWSHPDYRRMPVYAGSAALLLATALALWPVPPPDLTVTVTTNRTTYANDESVIIHFAGLPGHRRDWIGIVSADAPESEWGQWHVTGGQTEGDLIFSPPRPGGWHAGDYEVRVHIDLPGTSDRIVARRRITIINTNIIRKYRHN